MSNNMTSSTEWEQIYQQTTIDGQVTSSGLSEAPSDTVLSPNSDQLTPRGSVSKPMRRRSRASKKTNTTLLNANPNNFRALVQQFTGCPSTPFSFGSQRGPVNLNFGLGSDQQNQSNIATSIMAPSGSNYYYQNTQQLQQHEPTRHQQHQQVYQEQQCAVSFDSNVFSTSSISRPNMEIPEGCGLDDISFHELTRDSFSNENKKDNYFS